MHVVLYDSSWKTKHVRKTTAKLGYGLLFGSICLLLTAAFPIAKQEIASHFFQKPLIYEPKVSYAQLLAQTEEIKKRQQVVEEAAKYGVTTDYSVVIPKISAAAKVIPNVNPADEKSYKEALREGVAHAEGSKFPGEGGTIYLFSHSTNSLANISRFNAVFYSLKDLEPDDEIIIFYAGKKYLYKVTQRLITAADDLKWLTEEPNEERLILQTCWPPGTSLKRLLIVARLV